MLIGLLATTAALALAALAPPKADAYGDFSNGVLTIPGGEGNIVPRCAADGEIIVSGLPVTNGPAYCRDLKRIVARVESLPALFDFSQLPDDLGGGQGPIEIEATSGECCGEPPGDDKFIGAANHINIFDAGKGDDSVTGGNLNDTLGGGDGYDSVSGGGGDDTIKGGAGGDKASGGDGRDHVFGGGASDKLLGDAGSDWLYGGGAADKLLGGLGGDRLFGGGASDKLVGGPGKDSEKQ